MLHLNTEERDYKFNQKFHYMYCCSQGISNNATLSQVDLTCPFKVKKNNRTF